MCWPRAFVAIAAVSLAGLACTAGAVEAPRVLGVRLQAVNAPGINDLTTSSAVLVVIEGMGTAACALSISSSAAVVQPAAFEVRGFPVSRKLGTYLRGSHEVIVAPAQMGATPACAGLPQSVPIKVR
jgi:hypothetical protein